MRPSFRDRGPGVGRGPLAASTPGRGAAPRNAHPGAQGCHPPAPRLMHTARPPLPPPPAALVPQVAAVAALSAAAMAIAPAAQAAQEAMMVAEVRTPQIENSLASRAAPHNLYHPAPKGPARGRAFYYFSWASWLLLLWQ